ncbi:MAG: hypothetical protein QNJ46_22360 [Leptolyngbyaceae cyanobacterium MO_188.B28]|nr:hypothetical protein [Leptolyngbyaceae cyanobacterium MO_188.B28]
MNCNCKQHYPKFHDDESQALVEALLQHRFGGASPLVEDEHLIIRNLYETYQTLPYHAHPSIKRRTQLSRHIS